MPSKIEKVLVTISIDTECDHDINWVRANPITYDSINEGVPNRLQPAFDSIGAVPTYLLTVEVMEDEESVNTLRALKGNYEFGTHLHAAFIEPQKKFHDYAGIDSPDFQCSYPPDIEFQKLDNLTKLFKEKFGYSPTSFRAGRYGANAHSVNSLEKLGYKVDTSVTPLIKWNEPNAEVDFRKAPMQPYFPSKSALATAGEYSNGRILEAPVTIMPRTLRRFPAWFRPHFANASMMKKIVRYHMRKFSDRPVLNINMMFHSMEIIEAASPYCQSPEDVKRFIDEMLEGLSWCKDEGMEFCGLSDLYEPFNAVAIDQNAA